MTVLASIRRAIDVLTERTPTPDKRGWELDPIESVRRPDARLTVGALVYRGVTSGEVDQPVTKLAERLGADIALIGPRVGRLHGVEPARTIVAGFDPSTAPSIDVLVVPGGLGWKQVIAEPEIAEWLRSAAGAARGILAISTGSLLLASVGRLDGKHATGHWLAEDELAAMGATVESSRTAQDEMGRVATASGVLAAMTVIDELADSSQWSRWAPDD